jgi:hypothetical protein
MDENEQIEKEKVMSQLKVSYNMYEKTKKETEKKMKETLLPDGKKKYTKEQINEQIALITRAQDDILEQYITLGGKEEDIKKKTSKKASSNETVNVDKEDINETIRTMMENMRSEREAELKKSDSGTATRLEQDYIPPKGDYNPEAAFDVIPLPSKGEAYPDKIAKASVAYLTAYDENMIVSPNLYRDNLIIDYILQEKLLSKEIEPMDLLEGDREAIILFLRASGYGNEYPITATDDESGTEFETIVDLSKLKYKEFKLKGDSHGWFDFTLPVSKSVVKFRFPTHRDTVTLDKLQEAEEPRLMKKSIESYVKALDLLIENDKEIKKEDKINVRKAIRTIENWGEGMDEENALKFNHLLTNRLNLLIMSVDGITDRAYISNFIKRMNVRDSTALRKYMQENEPGIDYNITVERPESLGGGSFQTFLQLDQFLFLNITD